MNRSAVLFLTFLISLQVFEGRVFAAELGPYRLLRKLSQRLKGIDPASSEYQKLQERIESNQELDVFFDEKVAEYLNSDEFIDYISYRVQDLVRVPSAVVPDNLENQKVLYEEGSTNSLIRDIFSENRSWDELLIGKRYRISESGYYYSESDADFFEAIRSEAELDEDGILRFKSTDYRVAGILTSNAFRGRYHATTFNENRRKAQALFRIFLCDDLQPAVVPGGEKKAVVIQKLNQIVVLIRELLGLDEERTDLMGPASVAHPPIKRLGQVHSFFSREVEGDPHGNDPQCIVCHEKLDPAGRTFGGFSQRMMESETFSGALFMRRGEEVHEVKVNGIGELAEAVRATPEYASCQVNHFWKWIIGDNVPLSTARRAELVTEFNQDRRPTQWITKLLRQPEFRLDRTAELGGDSMPPPTFADVEPLLQRCNLCHIVHGVDFTSRPWGGSLESDEAWFEKMRDRLNLPEGTPGKMPANPDSWNEEELGLLKRWFEEGAPNE